MEIVPMSVPRTGDSHNVGLPFNRRNVEEWSRLDSITGMMEKAKIETDRWSASNSVGAHNFAKVVDSRERNRPDGSLQQRQRRQLEIFQSMVPGGSMQVIRSQTVTSSSSSSWTSGGKAFGELKLPVNHLDISSQKTKGSVGRSGSISGRRPPSRPRSLAGNAIDTLADVTAKCHRLHEEAKSRIFGTFTNGFDSDHDDDDDSGGVVITEIDSPSENSSQKINLNRQKSCSNENVNDDTEENSSIKRSSRFRRSLQFPKTSTVDDIPDWTNGKSLKERAAEIEDLLRRGSSTSYEIKKDLEKPAFIEVTPIVKSSFVTAESLKDMKDRLRKSSGSDTDKDIENIGETIRVKDFVSGMEAKIGNKDTVKTFEFRTRNFNNSSEWSKRRKSYGFENVDDSENYNGILSNGESSTDSGFGQLETSKTASPFRRYFEDSLSDAAWNRKSPLPIRERSSLRCNKNPWLSQLRGTKLVDRQWFNNTPDNELDDSGVPDSPKGKEDENKTFDFENSQKKQKKVEFCKTEVHFAAESGKFHIVETDGKPPPSLAVRRSRKKSNGRESPTQNIGLKFGDTLVEKKMLATTAEKIDSLSKKIESELSELSKIVVELPPKKEEIVPPKSLPKLYNVEEEDDSKPRSILKNFRKTFLLGEAEEAPVWRSTVVLQNKRFDDIKKYTEDKKSYSSDGESELQIRFRNLKKTEVAKNEIKIEPVSVEIKRRSLPDEVLLNGGRTFGVQKIEEIPILSVAERIKQVEEMRAKNYSTKIDFRSGEMTVLQNGTSVDKDQVKIEKTESRIWSEGSKVKEKPSSISDSKNTSNPSVNRFSTKDTSNTTKTTRISINIPCENKTQNNINTKKPYRSCSFGSRSQPCSKLQSTSLVMKTIKDSDILKTTKPVHEMINKFDSLAKPVRSKEQRRKTMPINYKAPKEYTHADLEEELKNFTEDLDKDFRDIYEEEIGTLKGSCRDLKNMFEQVCESSVINNNKSNTLPLMNSSKRRLQNGLNKKSGSSYEKISKSVQNGCLKSEHRVLPKMYESDDSDLLADEEVRSYMSTGHGGSDSDDFESHSGNRKKSFERIRLQFKQLEERSNARKNSTSEVKVQPLNTAVKSSFVEVTQNSEPYYASPPKVASISLRYEDDPVFSSQPRKTKELTDRWEKTSNSSSTMSETRQPRERISYLNGPSLSEKYTKRHSNTSLDNLFDATALERVKEMQDTTRSSFRSEGSTNRYREVEKKDRKRVEKANLTLEELSRAADEILVSINGMTDDSQITSSEDEQRKGFKKEKVSNLSTISEGRKASHVRETKTTVESSQKTREKSLSSRATRLLQRATNREAALAQRSSSEDIPANIEPVKKKLVRRPRVPSIKAEKETIEKTCSRSSRVRSKESSASIPRERVKTVSSAAKEVSSVSKTKTFPLTSDRTERTKPSQRRELLAKADAIAEQAVKSKRSSSNYASTTSRSDANQQSLTKRRARVSLRKVEAARIGQVV